jgi:DNA-binding transcriptional regulator YiaG
MAMIRQPENFPETVKEVRRQLALSQEELAHALGVSFATVNRWENGKTVPSKLAQRQFEQFCTQKRAQGALA